MAAREYTLELEIRRPRLFRLRSLAVATLLRVIGWLMGTTRVVEARKLSPEEKARLVATFEARYRRTVVDATGSVLSSPTPASTPDSAQVALRQGDDQAGECHDCGRAGASLHTHRNGALVCWPCFDARQGAAYGEPGSKFDPANCYDCGRPLGLETVRGRYTHRIYHTQCLKLDRGTQSPQVLG